MKQVHVRAITRQPRQVLRVVTWFPVAFCVAQGSHGTTILSHVLTLYVLVYETHLCAIFNETNRYINLIF